MRRISFHPGVWVGSLGLIFGGVFAVLSATLTNQRLIEAGWLSIALGLALAIWGIKFDGEHWWAQLPKLKLYRFRRGIYVGRILISDSLLESEHHLNFIVRAYNGTAQTLKYRGASGFAKIEFISNGNGIGGFDLQPPTLMTSNLVWPSGGEIIIEFRLSLTPAQVTEFQEKQATGATVQVLFGSLVVTLSRRWGRDIRLLLWDGVSFANGSVFGQIHHVQIAIGVGATASIGSRK